MSAPGRSRAPRGAARTRARGRLTIAHSGDAQAHGPADSAGLRRDTEHGQPALSRAAGRARGGGRQPQAPGPGDVAAAEHARVPAAQGRSGRGAARDRRARAQPRSHRRRADRRPATRHRRDATRLDGTADRRRCCRSSISIRPPCAVRERRAGMTVDPNGNELLGYAGILMGGERDELRPIAYRQPVPGLRPQALQGGSPRPGPAAIALLGGMGDGAGAGHVAGVSLPADPAHRAARARRRRARRRDICRRAAGSRGGDELGRLGRAFDAMAGRTIARRHRRAQARRRGAAGVGGKLPRDLRRRRGRDLRHRHRNRRDRRCQSRGPAPRSATAARSSGKLDLGALGSGVHPYTQKGAMGLFARAVSGEQLRVEWHGKNKDGTLRWQEVFGKRVTIGGEDRILALARDITDRKIAEEALRASEEQYRSMFNASIDGLALWNAAGEMVDTNPALWRMYGYSDGEFSTLHAGSWTGPSYRPDVPAGGCRRRIAAFGSDGAAQDGSAAGARRARHPDAVPGKAARADDRPRHHREEALRGGARAPARIARTSARSSPRSARCWPVSRTSSTTRCPSSSRGRCCWRSRATRRPRSAALKIRTAAERCARIVRTFLAMARQQQPERGPVAINEVVSAALDIASYAIRTSSIEVDARSRRRHSAHPGRCRPAPPGAAQPDHQCAAVAAGPARDAPDTRARAASTPRADMVRIEVADNGPGIPASSARARLRALLHDQAHRRRAPVSAWR